MSLEETLGALGTSIDLLTDALQAHSNLLRQQLAQPPVVRKANEPSVDVGNLPPPPSTTDNKPGRGRPRKDPPAAPMDLATTAPSSPTPAAGTQSTASQAATGEYAELQRLVPKVAELKGRSEALALFAKLGVKSGPDMMAHNPEKLPAAIALFKTAAGE